MKLSEIGRWGRRLPTQIFSLVAFNGYFWSPAGKYLCIPVLNCYACPIGAVACPIGTLSAFAAVRHIPFYVIGFLGVIGLAVGRAFCGWACPFGLIQDALYRARTFKLSLPRIFDGLKYALLVVLVLALPFIFGAGPDIAATESNAESVESDAATESSAEIIESDEGDTAAEATPEKSGKAANDIILSESAVTKNYCSLVCPAGTLEAGAPYLIAYSEVRGLASWRTWSKVGILVFVLGLVVVARRSFCRALCPLGALMALSSRISLMQLRTEDSLCTRCKRCIKVCPTDARRLPFDEKKKEATAECVLCLDCVRNCPEKGALSATLANRPVSVSVGKQMESQPGAAVPHGEE